MSTITIKEVPPALHRALKSRAQSRGRSLNREIIMTLESALHAAPIDAGSVSRQARAVRETMGIYVTQKGLGRSKEDGTPMIVVDVNALVYLWIPGDMTPLAERALARDPHWVSPLLWRSEFRSILAGYLRRGRLDRIALDRCIDGAESQLAGFEYLVPSDLVMGKEAASNCSAYDCEYVALAEDLKTTLITTDKQILAEFPSLSKSLKYFAAGA